MAHINSYRDREYFAHELPGNEVSQGIKQVSDTLFNNINTAVSVVQQANESTLANNQIDLSAKFLAKNNEINTKYQADPTNPQRETEIQQAFDSLASQYKINPLCQKQWSDIKSNVFNRYKTYNAQWALQQQQSNIQINLKNGYENLINQASMMALNGAGIDELRLFYANGIEGLRNGAKGAGEVYVNDFLKDSTHDFMTVTVSAMAQNNPLEAQKLLQREDVRNDIGKAETIEQLESYVSNSLGNQAKKTAVNELGNTLRGMNSKDADDILNGKADLNKVMKFIETNKKIPEGSKDLILDIYGLGSKTDYYYDRDKKKITKDPEGGSRRRSGSGGGVAVRKMTAIDKKMLSETLEQDLHNLLSFDTVNEVKTVKKNNTQQKASDGIVGYMKNVARMQERIDTAYHAGAITKDDRKRMMNQYIAPVTDYVEQNLEQLDEKWSWGGIAGNKLGYDKIKQSFDTKGLKGEELRSMQRQKLFAQNYYLDELYKASKKLGMKNIYDIESLTSGQQREIYKTASENALKRAKRWTDEPEIFFAKEYPEISMQPSVYFKANEAKIINRAVAEAVYKREFETPDGKSNVDLKDYAQLKCKDEILKKYKENQMKAGQTLGALQTGEARMHAPLPNNFAELQYELKNMGYSIKDFHEFAVQNGYVERLNNNQWRQGGYMGKRYMNALLDLRRAKSIKKGK